MMSAVVRAVFCVYFALMVTCQDVQQDGENDQFTDQQLRHWHDHVDHSNDTEVSVQELVHFAEQHHRNVTLGALNMDEGIALKDESEDGFVSLDEHLSATVSGIGETVEKMRADETAKFKAADVNGDGLLAADEIHALVAPETHEPMMDVVVSQSLRDADSDKNGEVSLDEFRNSGLADRGLPSDDTETDRSDGDGIASEDSLMKLNTSTQALFSRLDTNGDQRLDKKELRDLMSGKIQRENMIHHMVSTLDSDKDNHVDTEELIKGKNDVKDSQIQDYLLEWARHRYHNLPQASKASVLKKVDSQTVV